MPLFTVGRSAFTLSSAADSLIIASSAKPLRIMIADIKGLGASSSANEVIMYRATTAGSSLASGGITPSKVNTGSAAASFTVYTGFGSSLESTAGDVMWRFGVNGNGGQDKFVALPGGEISMPSSAYMGFRSSTGVSGAGVASANLFIEEVDG